MPEMLGKAESLLQKLRSSRSHDFPLLNECTRLGKGNPMSWENIPSIPVRVSVATIFAAVQLLEGSVTKMPDNDVKGVWRE